MSRESTDCSIERQKIDVLLETLKQVNYQNAMMLSWVNGAVIMVDREGIVTDANKTALDALGWNLEEFAGQPLHATIHHSQEDGSEYPWDFCPVFAAIEDGSSHHVDGDVFWQKDGSSFLADFIVCPVRDDANSITGAVMTFRNLTQQRLQEANRIHSMKLESIGVLAAGIAHEINTPIQFIGSNLSFLQESFQSLLELAETYGALNRSEAGSAQHEEFKEKALALEEEIDLPYLLDEAPKAFEQTQHGVNRVTKLVMGLKGFAHSGDGESKRSADLNEIAANSLIVCQNAYKYVARLTSGYDPHLPAVELHPSDIGQVVVNLVVNAAHAIAEVGKEGTKTGELGEITLRTWHDDQAVYLSVSDTGSGIPEGVRARVFDPFFTTKHVGQGSGQGLAISRQIIHDKHQGQLSFTSEVGQGTTFTIRLPRKPS